MIDLTNATPEDREDWQQAISYLSRDPEARRILAELDRRNTKVEFVHDGKDVYLPQANTIQWDPRSALAVVDGQGHVTGVQSGALGLAHEAVHATDPDLARHGATPNAAYTNDAESYAVAAEDRIAKTLGEPMRFNHYGYPLPERDPTEHTTTKADGSSVWVNQNGRGLGTYYPGTLPSAAPRGEGWRSLDSGSDSPSGRIGLEMGAARDYVSQLRRANGERPALDPELARRAADRGRD